MNCDCIEKAMQDVQNRLQEQTTKLISNVEFNETAWLVLKDNSVDTVTCSSLNYQIEGKKKPQTVTLTHTYCPFCGQPVRKPDEQDN